MKPSDKGQRLIRQLLLDAGKAEILAKSNWPDEAERRDELYAAVLTVICSAPEIEVREAVRYLSGVGFLDSGTLATVAEDGSDPEGRAEALGILAKCGIPEDEAESALDALCEIASGLNQRFGGLTQRYLRHYGELMLQQAPNELGVSSVAPEQLRTALAYWLQNCLNMPVSLEHADISEFCDCNGISEKNLVEAADAEQLNLAVLDDLVSLAKPEWQAAEAAGGQDNGDEPI